MNVILYENERVDNFYPFSVLHPTWELKTGCFSTYERVERLFGSQPGYLGRKDITESFLERLDVVTPELSDQDFCLYLESNLLFGKEGSNFLNKSINSSQSSVLLFKNKVVGLVTHQVISNSSELLNFDNSGFNEIVLPDDYFYWIEYLHDAITVNNTMLKSDFKDFFNSSSNVIDNVKINGEREIWLGRDIRIGFNVIFDTEEGPIIVDDDAKIEHGSIIYGPAYIGKKTVIKNNSVIEPGCSFGPVCKVGGEVENSIIQGYSNKQHSGFLGHSYLCEWINLGANTDTSDLKNTYDNIALWLRDELIETQQMFIGSLIGDHSKTAINTQLNTGTVIGIHSMIAHQGFPPNDIRSYNWTGSKKNIIYKIGKAIRTAEIVMKRRGKRLNQYERKLMEQEFERVREYYYNKKQ